MPTRIKIPSEFKEMVEVPMTDVIDCQLHEIGNAFIIRIKVPEEKEKFNDDHKHYTKSNINVCYAAPRTAGKSRNWYESQMTVTKQVREQQGYPCKGIPFFVVTDDGKGFLAHTSSDNNKQLSAIGDELILGRWIKGRLVEEGLVQPIEKTSEDVERKGMITKEMLELYGCNAIALQKTDLRMPSPENNKNSYEIWTLKLITVDDE